MYLDKLDAFVLAGLVLVIAASAYFVLKTPVPTSPCAGIDSLPDQLDCFADAANETGLAACTDASFPDACAGLFAFRKGSTDACTSWRDAQGCLYFYYSARLQYGAVNQSQGIAACRTLSNATWRYSCLDRHAQALKDSVFCHEMDIDSYRDVCLEQVNRIS